MKKILVVEDSESVRRSILDALSAIPGLEVTEAQDGAQGYQILQRQPKYFDLVLLDQQMPGHSGIDILRLLRDQGQALSCPVVMITTEVESRGSEIKDLQIIAWIIKPVRKPRLTQLVSQILEDLAET